MTASRWITGGVIMALLGGCTVGPDYVRPDVPTPEAFRFAVADARGDANVAWWTKFGDPSLVALIDMALASNWDLQIAAARVDEAAAVLTTTRARGLPIVGYGGDAERARVSEADRAVPGNPATALNPYINAGWELDLWGRIRRESEAAQANLVGAEEARRGVVLTLVSAVATTYLQLRALDAQRAVAEETRSNYAGQLDLFQKRFDGGEISEVTLNQARAQYETAVAVVPAIDGRIGTTENALSLLTGTAPHAIPRGRSFAAIPMIGVPAGLPSDLLTRRPDIAQAEQDLIAANADIGAAEALLFPRIALTGQGGVASSTTDDLFSATAAQWSIAANLAGPIFNGGSIRARIFASEAQQRAALANYRQTILSAFREVSDGLVGYSAAQRQLGAETRLVEAQSTTARLAYMSFQEGVESYTTVLVAQNDLLDARLDAIDVRYAAFANLVAVYKAMGGGWVDIAAAKAPAPTVRQAPPT